jgi:hypothetical protein
LQSRPSKPGLTIEKLEHRLHGSCAFNGAAEKMDNAQLRMMFEDVDGICEPANDDVPASNPKPERKAGTRAPIPAHIPRLTAEHRPEPCRCGGVETVICEDVTEVLDYVPARPCPASCAAPYRVPVVRGNPTGACHRSALAQGHGQQRAARPSGGQSLR